MITLYMHINKINGKSYIGQTKQSLQRRIREGFVGYKGCSALHNAVKKYGGDAFETKVLCQVETIEEANELEGRLISEYQTLAPNGYNLQTEGENKHLSDETKAKIGKASKGRIPSEDTRKKMGDAHRGKEVSESTRKKISDANKGKKRSIEQRRRMSEARKGRKLSHVTKQKISESNKGRKREPFSDEHRSKLSNSLKGRKVWNKGKKTGKIHSDDHKKRLSERMKGNDYAKGKASWNKGKKMSEETKQKLSDFNKGKKLLEETKRKMSESHKKRWDRKRKEGKIVG